MHYYVVMINLETLTVWFLIPYYQKQTNFLLNQIFGKGRRQKKNCRFSDICSNRGGGVWKKPNSKNKFNWDQILMGGGIQHFFQFSIEKFSILSAF